MTPEMMVIWLTPLLPAVACGYLLKSQYGKATFNAVTFAVFIYLFMVVGQLALIKAAQRWNIPFPALMLALAVAVFFLFRWQAGSRKR
jgi:quinol-cytochrome oxidoreductase complex cytochrome b subunit